MEAEEKPDAMTCPYCRHVLGGAVAYCPFCGERQAIPSPPESADTPGTSSAIDAARATPPVNVSTPPKEDGEAKTAIPGESGGGPAQQTTKKREEPPAFPQNGPADTTSGETGGGTKATGEDAGYGESTIHVEKPDRPRMDGRASRKTVGTASAQPDPRQAKRDDGGRPKPGRLPRLILVGMVCLLAVWGIAKVRQNIHDTTGQRYALAFRAYQDKRLTDAKKMLVALLHDNPDDTKARDLNDQITATRQRHEDMYKRAMRELKSGRENQAKKLLLTIVREDSDNTKARNLLEKYWSKREPDSMQPDSNRPAEPTPAPTPEPAPTPTPDQPPAQAPEPTPAPMPNPAPATATRRNKPTVDCQALGQKVQEAIKGSSIQEAGNLASQAAKGQCPQADALRRKVEDAKSSIPNWQWK